MSVDVSGSVADVADAGSGVSKYQKVIVVIVIGGFRTPCSHTYPKAWFPKIVVFSTWYDNGDTCSGMASTSLKV